MKKGLILYITGEEPRNSQLRSESINKISGDFDHVEYVSKDSGRFDVHEAWFNLAVRGIHSIKCRTARFRENGDLELSGRELSIC